MAPVWGAGTVSGEIPERHATDDRSEVDQLRECKSRKDRGKLLADLFMLYRDRLRFMVKLRLHPRLRARIDPSDVLQDAFLEATKKLAGYLRNPRIPVFLWFRRITGDKLHYIHRHYLDAQVRDPRREIRLSLGPAATSETLAGHLVQEGTSPSGAAVKLERKAAITEALEKMDPMDREILVLRYFEGLSSPEAAKVLEIKEATAAKRYLRALKRLKEIVRSHPRLESKAP